VLLTHVNCIKSILLKRLLKHILFVKKRYNLQTHIELLDRVTEEGMGGGLLSARPGELFAKVPLNEQLNEDTDAGLY